MNEDFQAITKNGCEPGCWKTQKNEHTNAEPEMTRLATEEPKFLQSADGDKTATNFTA